MKQLIVRLEYIGACTKQDAQEYRILSVFGGPNVEVQKDGNYVKARVGEIISEKQAEELANRVTVNTQPKQD